VPARATLAFVGGERYELVEIDVLAERGSAVEIEGDSYVVAKVGPSPLPGDARRCAYLTRGGPPRPSRGSS
jgi:hypothetical protein